MSISKQKALARLETVKARLKDSSVMSAEERNAAFDDLYVVEFYIREREETSEYNEADEKCVCFDLTNREIAIYTAIGVLALSLIIFGVFV